MIKKVIKNSFSKLKKIDGVHYLLELIIVFIGVSLAFFINQKEQDKELKLQEKEYLMSIKNDLEIDINAHGVTIAYLKEEIERFVIARDLIIEKQTQYIDSIASISTKLSETTKYHPRVSTFQLLTDNGDLIKIKNVKLKTQIATYYAYLKNLSKHHQEVNTVKEEELKPYLNQSYNWFKKEVVNDDAYFDIKMLNILYHLRTTLVNRIVAYNKALEMCKELNEQLDKELEKIKNNI